MQKPFGIILFIGEGLDPARIAAARIYAGSADTPLTIDSLNYNALLKNYSKDFATPDQAAAATAYATGVKVKNGALGVDVDGKALENLFELARASGRVTGLVTNGSVTDPSAAGFYAHTSATDDRPELARVLVENSGIDIVLGGGSADFLPIDKEGDRPDERDLLSQIPQSGYEIVQTLEDLEAVPRWRAAKVFGLFSRNELAPSAGEERRGDQPTLSDMVRRSIELLQFHSGGYLLVVDTGLMGRAARANNGKDALAETVELDRAISVALRYAGTKSTIIVCGDVAIGGMNLSGFPPREKGGADLVADKPNGGPPWLTWATGPNGPVPSVETPPDFVGPVATPTPERNPSEPAAVYAKAAENAASDVVAFANGLGADALQATMENTAIFEIIRDNL